MTWIKKGLIIAPDERHWWNKTHAMLPTVSKLHGNFFKFFYSGRDSNGRSQIGFSIIEIIADEIFLRKTSIEPVLEPGERGCFDDNGVTPSCVLDKSLYYIGWNSGTTTFRMSLIMGLAFEKNNVFIRNSRAPLLNKTDREPFGISTAPYVIKSKKGFEMWYVSGEAWINRDLPKYNIKYASSHDGIQWTNNGEVALELLDKETALARPCILYDGHTYEMYFSYKDPQIGYRIGYATSSNGKKFKRSQDQSHYLNVSEEGWDSEMVEYSFVFEHQNIRFMLYNGNNYGENGIGYAVKK